MYRGLIHFHSNYSYDSILSIKNIVKFAQKENLNFLALTDHDTIKGSIELKKYIDHKKIDIEVIMAAEYCTEYGDVIALGIKEEITEMKFDLFVQQVKQQNGLLFFPHPYYGHTHIEDVAQKVDFIEVFNSRVDKARNGKAIILSNKYKKHQYYATDAHNYKSLKNSIIEVEKAGTLIESFRNNTIYQLSAIKTRRYEVLLSQFVKSFKRRNLNLFISLVKDVIIYIIRFNLYKKI